jgi:hypothetical protein
LSSPVIQPVVAKSPAYCGERTGTHQTGPMVAA